MCDFPDLNVGSSCLIGSCEGKREGMEMSSPETPALLTRAWHVIFVVSKPDSQEPEGACQPLPCHLLLV